MSRKIVRLSRSFLSVILGRVNRHSQHVPTKKTDGLVKPASWRDGADQKEQDLAVARLHHQVYHSLFPPQSSYDFNIFFFHLLVCFVLFLRIHPTPCGHSPPGKKNLIHEIESFLAKVCMLVPLLSSWISLGIEL